MPASEMEKLLRNYFTNNEVSAPWNKLKREIDRHKGEIKRKWTEIEKMPPRSGAQACKREILSLRLAKLHQRHLDPCAGTRLGL